MVMEYQVGMCMKAEEKKKNAINADKRTDPLSGIQHCDGLWLQSWSLVFMFKPPAVKNNLQETDLKQ